MTKGQLTTIIRLKIALKTGATGIPSQYEKVLIMARRVKHRVEKTPLLDEIHQKLQLVP